MARLKVSVDSRYADMEPHIGSEQGGKRPVVVLSHAVQQFYISQPSLTNAIRELEQEVGLALSKTASSVVSRTLLEYLRSTRQRKDAPQIK